MVNKVLHRKIIEDNAAEKKRLEYEQNAILYADKKEKCQICNKGFDRPLELSAHMRTHEKRGEVDYASKPYKCELCEKAFDEKYELARHIIFHRTKSRKKKVI